jgi:tRNA-(ms[2]io[6]A)-hydroxylase
MLCLRVPTDAAWTVEALQDTGALLADHAHCELKAASNALSLVARHPDDLELASALTEVAMEEVSHFQRVLALLAARGIPLGPPPVDEYAASLRRAASELPASRGAGRLVDRLLVAALIEARSCERFKLLADAGGSGEDPPLVAFWRELFAAEAGHFRTFVDLAEKAAKGDRSAVDARLAAIADVEGAIVAALPRNARKGRASIHG